VTEVDRATRCILSWAVVWERTTEALQDVVEGAAPALQYYSDALTTYETLVYYPGRHAVAPGKSQTYSVEADNAELRHYLARLGRKSRCFSRSIDALRRAVKLFVHAWNRRQLHKRAFPRYACHVMDFVCP
jgi:insertion element IS1 protein InsB